MTGTQGDRSLRRATMRSDTQSSPTAHRPVTFANMYGMEEQLVTHGPIAAGKWKNRSQRRAIMRSDKKTSKPTHLLPHYLPQNYREASWHCERRQREGTPGRRSGLAQMSTVPPSNDTTHRSSHYFAYFMDRDVLKSPRTRPESTI